MRRFTWTICAKAGARRRRGWTLVHVLVGMTVLATLSVTTMDLLGRSSEATHLSWELDLATALAESQLELVRATHTRTLAPGENQPLFIGGEALVNLPFGDGKMDVFEQSEGLLRVRSRVAWGAEPRRREVVLETLVARPTEAR